MGFFIKNYFHQTPRQNFKSEILYAWLTGGNIFIFEDDLFCKPDIGRQHARIIFIQDSMFLYFYKLRARYLSDMYWVNYISIVESCYECDLVKYFGLDVDKQGQLFKKNSWLWINRSISIHSIREVKVRCRRHEFFTSYEELVCSVGNFIKYFYFIFLK